MGIPIDLPNRLDMLKDVLERGLVQRGFLLRSGGPEVNDPGLPSALHNALPVDPTLHHVVI
jgi:hypothetical protein